MARDTTAARCVAFAPAAHTSDRGNGSATLKEWRCPALMPSRDGGIPTRGLSVPRLPPVLP